MLLDHCFSTWVQTPPEYESFSWWKEKKQGSNYYQALRLSPVNGKNSETVRSRPIMMLQQTFYPSLPSHQSVLPFFFFIFEANRPLMQSPFPSKLFRFFSHILLFPFFINTLSHNGYTGSWWPDSARINTWSVWSTSRKHGKYIVVIVVVFILLSNNRPLSATPDPLRSSLL